MRKRWRLLVAGVALALFILLGAYVVVVGFLWFPPQDKWYREQEARLRGLQVTPEVLAAAMQWKECDDGVWRVGFNEGLIAVGKRDWVYVVTRSSHRHAVLYQPPIPWRVHRPYLMELRVGLGRHIGWGPPVGDAILAIDSRGRLYTNDGHICGGVSLSCARVPQTLDEFWRDTLHRLERPWRPYGGVGNRYNARRAAASQTAAPVGRPSPKPPGSPRTP